MDRNTASTTRPGSERIVFFEFQRELAAFNESVSDILRQSQRQVVNQRLAEENTQRFSHGRSWAYRASPDASTSQMREHSATWELKFQDIVDGDLSHIPKSLTEVAAQLERQFIEGLYATVSGACDQTGNVVSAQNAGSFAAGFLEALRKIEFGVDTEGKVSVPQVHIAGGLMEKIMKELESQPPEYHAEVERLKSEKSTEALMREAQRKARFKGCSY